MFFQYLKGHITKHVDEEVAYASISIRLDLRTHIIFMFPNSTQSGVGTLAEYAAKQLEKISEAGPKRGIQAPTADEISYAIEKIRNPSVYGSTLTEVMDLQKDRFPGRVVSVSVVF